MNLSKWVIVRNSDGVNVQYQNLQSKKAYNLGTCHVSVSTQMVIDWILNKGKMYVGDLLVLPCGTELTLTQQGLAVKRAMHEGLLVEGCGASA